MWNKMITERRNYRTYFQRRIFWVIILIYNSLAIMMWWHLMFLTMKTLRRKRERENWCWKYQLLNFPQIICKIWSEAALWTCVMSFEFYFIFFRRCFRFRLDHQQANFSIIRTNCYNGIFGFADPFKCSIVHCQSKR